VADAEIPRRPCIEVLEGRSRGQVFELVRRQTVIGRNPGADLRIEDAGVSRRHVKLSLLDDGSVLAADMRSTNGMIINGEKLERATLHEGDQLRLGPDALLRFSSSCADELRARHVRAVFDERAAAEILEPTWSGAPPQASSPSSIERTEDALQLSPLRRPKLDDLPLSARQIEVGRLVANGLTNAVIAERLGISHRTVTSHLDHIYGRLGIGSRAALARWIVERGLLEPEQPGG
jgi:DNA-binding CsgD family transcriptional regulator